MAGAAADAGAGRKLPRPYREVFDEIREDARRKDDMVNAMIREAMTWEHYSRGIPAIDLLMFRKMLEAALDSAR